jgi:hypothetical protein
LLKKLGHGWPILTSLGVGFLNMEVVVIPFILIGYFGLWDVGLKITAVCWATCELMYWYWFSGWLITRTSGGQRAVETIKNAVDFGRSVIIPKARKANIIETTQEWIIGQINKFNPNKYKNKRIFRFVRKHGRETARRTGKLLAGGLLIAVAAVPTPILWVPALAACRTAKWRTGLFCMMIGNAIKNWIFCNAWMWLITQM